MTLKQQAYNGAKWTSLSSGVTAVIQLLRIAILARILQKADFGLMALVTMIIGFMSLFSDMGISSAILHKQNTNEKEYSSLYWLNFIINIFLFILVCIASYPVSLFYKDPQLFILIPLMGTNLFFTAWGRQYAVIAQKTLHFRFTSIVEILTNLISLAPAIILALKGWGIYSLIYSTLFASFFSNLFFFWGIKKQHKILFHFKFSETRPFLRIGLYQTGGQILNYFSQQIDVLIIGKLLGMDVLGLYNLGKNLAMRPQQIINPIVTKISAPVLSLVQHDTNSLRKGYLKIMRILSFVNCPVYFLLSLLSLPIIKIVYGISDPVLAKTLSILSLYYMVRSMGNPVGGLMIAKGRTDLEFYWNMITMPLFAGCIFLGAKFSIIGISIAQLILFIFLFVVSWYFMIKKTIGGSIVEYFSQILPYILFSVASCGVAYFVLKMLHLTSVILECIAGAGIMITLYLICIYVFDHKTITLLLK